MTIRTLVSVGAVALFCAFSIVPQAFAEGSRSLYPADYLDRGARASRANLDLQPNQSYLERINRRAFLYVYAEAGELILLGSSNIGDDFFNNQNELVANADVLVFNPQDFGTPGDETVPGIESFSCVNGVNLSSNGASNDGSFFGGGRGLISSRDEELAGPDSADGSANVPDSFTPCAYRAPETGIYGVLFTPGGSNTRISASVPNIGFNDDSVAAWDVTVRSSASADEDLNGRLFTYALVAYTGGNNRPVYTSSWYITNDGYRYRQDLEGLDPNGWALYANTYGFLDNNEPLYRNIRGTNATISNIAEGLSTQPAQFPIFFNDVDPTGPNAAQVDAVLSELNIPLTPPTPEIQDVRFVGTIGEDQTTTGAGGTFSFTTTDTLSYQIVISQDTVSGNPDFDPALPTNRLLTGIALTGFHEVEWDGRDNDGNPFPAGTDYPYRAWGRNGEVHFPIIDAENNGTAEGANPFIRGGGPIITRLNGGNAPDNTVYFDDRGYVTSRGEAIGTLNGNLCPSASPAAPDPAEALAGVASDTRYRLWENGSNRNRDCDTRAGWGDAKALNLWTYFLTQQTSLELDIQPVQVDLGTTVSAPTTALPHTNSDPSTIQGVFSFSNNGSEDASGVVWRMQLAPNLVDVNFPNLPVIDGTQVTASYDPDSGLVTFDNVPDIMEAGASYDGLIYSYQAPTSGDSPVSVTTTISTTDNDTVPENDEATAVTLLGELDLSATVEGVPATVEAGEPVTGTVTFANLGGLDGQDVVYTLSFGEPGNAPESVDFTLLPAGAEASYDPNTGIVTLTGMPGILAVADLQQIGFSYPAPRTDQGPIVIRAGISTSSNDGNSANDTSEAGTEFFYIDVTAASVCINDAPYVEWDITAVNFTPDNLATLEFIGSDNLVVQTVSDLPLSNGRILWPEAAVDSEGRGSAWPGWELDGNTWVQIPSTVRPELTVRFSVNPSLEDTFSYPPATEACNSNPRNIQVVGGPRAPGAGGTHGVPLGGPFSPLLALLLAAVGLGAVRRQV